MSLQDVQGSCQCEANQFNVMDKPIARFICHCLVCQKYTGKPFSDVLVFLKKDIAQLDIAATDFKRYKLPPNIRRGTCKKCLKPSIEFGILEQFAFIPASNIHVIDGFDAPSMHIFYHRRKDDIEDDLPKYSGFVKSQTMVSALVGRGLYQRFI